MESARQNLETAHQEVETFKALVADKEDKHQKVVKAARALKSKFDSLKEEKERVKKEFEEAKGVCMCVCVCLMEWSSPVIVSQEELTTKLNEMEEAKQKAEANLCKNIS